jgi:hypothetical protein
MQEDRGGGEYVLVDCAKSVDGPGILSFCNFFRLFYGFVGGLLYCTNKLSVILIAVALRRLLRAENQTLSYGKQAW